MLYSILFLKKKKENVINRFALYFSIRMETLSIESNLFEDSEQLSAPLKLKNSICKTDLCFYHYWTGKMFQSF